MTKKLEKVRSREIWVHFVDWPPDFFSYLSRGKNAALPSHGKWLVLQMARCLKSLINSLFPNLFQMRAFWYLNKLNQWCYCKKRLLPVPGLSHASPGEVIRWFRIKTAAVQPEHPFHIKLLEYSIKKNLKKQNKESLYKKKVTIIILRHLNVRLA